jgi:hypothetical protein
LLATSRHRVERFGLRPATILFWPRWVRSKATRRRVAFQKLRETEPKFSLLFAPIRVIRGPNFGCSGAALVYPRSLSSL